MVAVFAAAACVCAGQSLPELRYSLKFHLRDKAPCIEVSLDAKNLVAAADLSLELPDHGEWSELDALYLRDFVSAPPAAKTETTKWKLPSTTSLKLGYRIPLIDKGTNLYKRHGLLPHVVRDAKGSIRSLYALSNNVLMRIERGGEPIIANTSIKLENDLGFDLATGWGDISKGGQAATFTGALEESPIIGGKAWVSRDMVGPTLFEVAQFAGDADVSKSILAVAMRLIPAFANSTGMPIDHPIRIFAIHKGGGQWLDRACLVQTPTAEAANSPYSFTVLSHELFHNWLGGYAKPPSESMVWFTEGFTDYFSYYHIASTELGSPLWFVERVFDSDYRARNTDAYGKVAFADASIAWRSEANEGYGYKGGATLAFCLDAELYARGKPSLAGVIKALASQPGGVVTLPGIEDWLRANGVGDLVEPYLHKPGLPDVREALRKAGFERKAVKLSYLGIKTEPGPGRGKVVELDPEGPAAKAGVKVGDAIMNTSARLDNRPEILSAPNQYRFGLELFDPSRGPIKLDIQRGDSNLVLTMEPTAYGEGGLWQWNHAKGEKTFLNR